LEFSHAKYNFSIPYSRISNVQIYMTERRYEKTAEVSKLAGVYGVPASVLILLVRKQADVLVFDYTNPSGGVQGAVLRASKTLPRRLQAFVEQDLHAIFASSESFASSSARIAFSRDTVGNWRKNSPSA